MIWERETRMKFLVVGMDSCAPDLMPVQGYFDDDEIKSCPRCDSRFENHDEVRLASHPFIDGLWYAQRLEHVDCAQKAKVER